MFTVYILYSASSNRFYIGHTANLEDRFSRHNNGRSSATKAGIPWILVRKEAFATKAEAMRRERQIKAWKSAIAIRKLVGEHPDL